MMDTEHSVHRLVRREAVLHFNDGETSMRGFLTDFFYSPDAILVAKPTLLVADQSPEELGGDVLVYENQIKFIQILGG